MNGVQNMLTDKAFNLKQHVEYADGSVVSKTLLKEYISNIKLFTFNVGRTPASTPRLSMPSFKFWTARPGSPSVINHRPSQKATC